MSLKGRNEKGAEEKVRNHLVGTPYTFADRDDVESVAEASNQAFTFGAKVGTV